MQCTLSWATITGDCPVITHTLLFFPLLNCTLRSSMCNVCSSCLLTPDTSLNPHTLLHVVSTARKLCEIGRLLDYLDVPYFVWDEIRANPSYSSEEEKRMAVLEYSLETVPDMSWGKIAGVLWCLEEHTALEAVRQYLPHKPGDYITCTVLYWLYI